MAAVRTRSEHVREAAALATVGGFLDAYAFLAHGGVFANAQTGNVVLFGVEAAGGHWSPALRHVPPLLAFVAGIATVEAFSRLRGVRLLARPTRLVLIGECAVFVLVGLVALPNTLATVLIAYAATLQVGTFRQVGPCRRSGDAGIGYNSTFTTGNLRSLVEQGAGWLVDRDRVAGGRARALAAVVGGFSVGAVLGGLAERGLHRYAVLLVVPVLLLLLAGIVRETAATSARTAAQTTGPDISSAG